MTASVVLKAASIGFNKPFARTPFIGNDKRAFAPKVASSNGICSKAALPAMTFTGQRIRNMV